MAKRPTGEVPSIALQPPAKVIPNEPASSVAQALKNSQAQVEQAK
jgi:hypothetical protein